jgi:hypothetical protein
VRLLSRTSQARYNSTLRIQDLISPECALPSRIVKEQPTAFSFALSTEKTKLNAVQSIGASGIGDQASVKAPQPRCAVADS